MQLFRRALDQSVCIEALLEDLQSELNDAINNENYEEAARLRDEISRLKSSS